MPVDLYYMPGSAPCRSVRLTARALGLKLNLKQTDLMKGEHMTPEYLKVGGASNLSYPASGVLYVTRTDSNSLVSFVRS